MYRSEIPGTLDVFFLFLNPATFLWVPEVMWIHHLKHQTIVFLELGRSSWGSLGHSPPQWVNDWPWARVNQIPWSELSVRRRQLTHSWRCVWSGTWSEFRLLWLLCLPTCSISWLLVCLLSPSHCVTGSWRKGLGGFWLFAFCSLNLELSQQLTLSQPISFHFAFDFGRVSHEHWPWVISTGPPNPKIGDILQNLSNSLPVTSHLLFVSKHSPFHVIHCWLSASPG